jgi:hypothetical protein
MPVSGLLLTLAGTEQDQSTALAAIEAHPAFTCGEIFGRWLPVAMEARDDRESRDLHDWLMAQPGIGFVDVVAVNFSELESEPVAFSPELQ